MFPVIRESHIFQRQQRATLGDKSLKICKEIMVRTYNVKDILYAAQVGKQLVTLRASNGVPVEECVVFLGKVYNCVTYLFQLRSVTH